MIPAAKSVAVERLFLPYVRAYLRRSFHTLHLLGEPPQTADDGHTPLLVCFNHSSWWDPMLAFYIAKTQFDWEIYGVMEERQLRRYRFFTKLGCIGVDRTTLRGAKEFLRYTTDLLRGQRRALWLTPQGEMLSNHLRPLRFQPGVAHLAGLLGDFYFTTVALHIEFWNERLPEAFVSLSPLDRFHAGPDFDRTAFLHAQERRLEAQLDALLAAAQTRDATVFQPLLLGKTSISPVYDTLRRLSARLRREPFSAEHGSIITPPWKNQR